jgi:hypothetical protein
MKRIALLLIVFSTVLAACGKKPPGPPNLENTIEEYDASFDQVWAGVIEILGFYQSPIELIEKDSGLITTEWQSGGARSWFDCGAPGSNREYVDVTGRFNIVVSNLADGNVRVHVNTYWRADNGKIECSTTGEYEALFHERLREKLPELAD